LLATAARLKVIGWLIIVGFIGFVNVKTKPTVLLVRFSLSVGYGNFSAVVCMAKVNVHLTPLKNAPHRSAGQVGED